MQIGANIEVDILISDNASTDNTQEIVDQYQQYSPFIRYHRNPENIGFDGNIVICIKYARGEYIWFLSDDDILLKGTLERVIKEITTHNPTIIYLNHAPFLKDPNKRMKSMSNTEDKIYNDGKEYFLKCGLGFISALILKSDIAKKYYHYGINCLFGEAHIEIASRIALEESGPFLYLGSLSISAKIPAILSDDYFTCYRLNVDKLYKKLEIEGLLDANTVRLHFRNVIKDRAASILHNKCIGNHRKLVEQKDEIVKLYGEHKMFYLYIYPFIVMPRWLLIPPYVILRQFVRKIRKLKHA
jgi:glycosyltransferase involved in cell wall biosynthesis